MRFPVTTGIILAGGAGHRLGYPKSLQKINEQSMIERVAIRISSVSDTLLIITNREQFNAISNLGLKAKIVVDCSPGQGPLIGIYTGLSISNTFYNLIVGCDMPTLNVYLLRHFIKSAPGYDAVVPVLKNKTEPLHSIYSKNCIAHIKQLIDQGIRSVSPLFSMVNTRYICEDEIDAFDPHYLSFFNVNTRRDKIKAEAIIKQLDRGA